MPERFGTFLLHLALVVGLLLGFVYYGPTLVALLR